MKRITIIAALIIIALSGILAMGNSKDMQQNKTDFTKLWKEYNSASRSDSPAKGLQVLEQIKTLAEESRNPWEFYRAGDQYWRTASQRNWKVRDSLRQAFQDEIARFDEPILTFFNERDSFGDKAGFLKKNKAALKAGHNADFYRSAPPSTRVFSPVLAKMLKNDYDYAVWYTYLSRRHNDDEEVRGLLKEEIGETYPLLPFMEFNEIQSIVDASEKIDNLKAFEARYKGEAVGLFATQSLLSDEFSHMDKAVSDDFKRFREKCAGVEKTRKSFRGSEAEIADCCTQIKGLIDIMDSQSMIARVTEGELAVITRNIEKVEVEMKQGDRSIFKTTIKNQIGSYYLEDTIKYTLPVVNDGQYDIICSEGKLKDNITYEKYTISMAKKLDSKGHHVYAAQSVSGKPLNSATISVIDDKKKELAKAEGLDFSEGYVLLPAELQTVLKEEKTRSLVCKYIDESGILHSSLDMTDYGYYYTEGSDDHDQWYGTLITDRSAFNPDETVQFKGILYHGDRRKCLQADEGKEVKVRLKNVDGEIIDTKTLRTNEFGSVAGEFRLPRGGKNGIYELDLIYIGDELAYHSIRVDDFVLPTFELTFEPETNLNLAGENISVKGRIQSYSGHTLAGADVSYTVELRGDMVTRGKLELDEDGRFEITFKTSNLDYQYFTVTVKVVDNTGETLSWSTGRRTLESIPFYVEVLDQAEGTLDINGRHDLRYNESYGQYIISDDKLKLHFDVKDYGSGTTISHKNLSIRYKLLSSGKTIASGEARPGQDVSLDLGSHKSGLYTLEAECICKREGKEDLASRSTCDVLLVRDSDTSVDADIENVFKVIDGEQIGLMFGTTSGSTWANVDVYGTGNILLAHRFINLSGRRAQKGSLERIVFDWLNDWPDVVEVSLLYFRNNHCHVYNHQFDRSSKRLEMPLAFTRFEDRTRPGTEHQFEISTLAGAECAAAIFDKSTETIMSNRWYPVQLLPPPGPTISYRNICGRNESHQMVMYKSGAARMLSMSKSADVMEEQAMDYEAMEAPVVMKDNAMVESEEAAVAEEAILVRENFANTIAFEPFLRADSDGHISLKFKNADKLSTYYIQLFAHDKDMHNAVLRKEMLITIPVKVAIVEPQFLYTGDRYVLKASASSNITDALGGRMIVEWYDGDKLIDRAEKRMALKAMGSEACEFPLEVPSVKELGVKISFIADAHEYGADAVFVRIPVHPAVQVIREAHSSILHFGESEAELVDRLRRLFVNVPGSDASVSVKSLLDMAHEAVPGHVEPASKNVLDLSEALYSRAIASTIRVQLMPSEISDDYLVESILACQNSDGGFGWFADMSSSPAITASLLTRIASMRRNESCTGYFSDEIVSNAVRYLDRSFLGDNKRPYWCGGISFDQYISVRSCFSEIPFSTEDMDKDKIKGFRKAVKEYLVPGKERGLNAIVLGKAQRMRVLYQLLNDENGVALAKDWGIRILSRRRLDKSLEADFKSLMEYAIEHKSGGWYYPNAVMPFRGLLESEAYAHVFICEILEDCAVRYNYSGPAVSPASVADGIRLWLMIQKETQKWDESPEFVEALACILNGSKEILSTSIVSLSGSKEMPFESIQKSGNGMKIELSWFVKDNDSVWKELSEGDTLHVGDAVRAEYKIWNEENRSFVKLTAPRAATLRPTQQLSGHIGWWLRPLTVSGWMSFSPQGYRSVLSDKTEYWFDSYPEESSIISEEFFVTQEGEFHMPVIEIESLYAPHYRANDIGHPRMTSR